MRLESREGPARELGSFPTLAAIRGWARENHRELPACVAAVQPETVREVPSVTALVRRFGQAHPATWAESVVQVAMHSSYHRGQVVTRLRELDVESPLTDYIAWIWMGRPLADWGSDEAA
jgi:uncharacterized damage-inducible protein DinB